MSDNDQYALNWSNHTNHIKKAFHTLLQRDEFVDVTISCGSKKIKAHRMILSACSPYFHDLLHDNPGQHPIIILRDFEYENIESIIRFMYNGEVQVPIENFGSFLKAAEFLEVSGLTGDSQTKDVTSVSAASVENTGEIKERVRPAPASKKLERKKITESRKRPSIDDISQYKKKKDKHEIKEEVIKPSESVDENINDDGELSSINEDNLLRPMSTQKISNVQEVLGGDESYLTKEANPECECPVCAQKFGTIYLLKQHVPFHLGETKCHYCGSTFARRDLLKKHQINVHKINPSVFK